MQIHNHHCHWLRKPVGIQVLCCFNSYFIRQKGDRGNVVCQECNRSSQGKDPQPLNLKSNDLSVELCRKQTDGSANKAFRTSFTGERQLCLVKSFVVLDLMGFQRVFQ